MILEKYRQQCLDKLIWSLAQLKITVEVEKLNQIAALIVQTMTGPWRYFHTPEHIFEVGGDEDPIEVLAALFHDIVYVQVDRSVHFNLTYYICSFIKQVGEQLLIRPATELPDDTNFAMVAAIFGFNPSQYLSPFSGQNEFLSALVAAKILEPCLTPRLIAEIVACIEATIPFRPQSDWGLTASDRLYQRLKATNQGFHLNLTDAELIQTIQRSVRLANRDVGGFGGSSSRFLDNTWSLLPETNHRLKYPSSYTVQEYRIALEKMLNFLDFLKPEVIFHQFQGEPDERTYQGLLQRASHNLKVGRLYLRSKLLAIAILEALSLRVGQDVPLVTMAGELPVPGITEKRLEDFLPSFTSYYQPVNTLEKEVLELLENGRTQNFSYDVSNLPLTAFIVKVMGFAAIKQQWVQVQEFFEGKISGEAFLASCHPEIVSIVTQGVIKLFDRRRAALSGW